MYNPKHNSGPSASPSVQQAPTYDIQVPSTSVPSTKEVKTKVTSDRKPKQLTGSVGEFVQDNKLTIFQIVAATGLTFLTLKAILPDSDLLKIVLNPVVNTVVPSLILYSSAEFGWRKGVEIGFFWQFVFTPVALLIVIVR